MIKSNLIIFFIYIFFNIYDTSPCISNSFLWWASANIAQQHLVVVKRIGKVFWITFDVEIYKNSNKKNRHIKETTQSRLSLIFLFILIIYLIRCKQLWIVNYRVMWENDLYFLYHILNFYFLNLSKNMVLHITHFHLTEIQLLKEIADNVASCYLFKPHKTKLISFIKSCIYVGFLLKFSLSDQLQQWKNKRGWNI